VFNVTFSSADGEAPPIAFAAEDALHPTVFTMVSRTSTGPEYGEIYTASIFS
jgi:hypothetical protein